jgi:hypothetical protein
MYLNEFRSEVLSMLRPRMLFSSNPSQVCLLPPGEPLAACPASQLYVTTVLFPQRSRAHNQPIAYGICADFSLGKQQFYEKHEGVKIMSWSTSKERSHLLLPSLSGTPKAADASISQDDAVSRVKSGSTPSAAVKGGWYHGLEVYLFRILTETSMSVGWGRMLKDKRVRALVVF